MHARIFTLQVKAPDMVDTVYQIVRDALLPASQQFPGMTDVFQLANREMGKISIICFLDTEPNARLLTDNSFINEQLAKMVDLLVAPPGDEIYEMLL